MKNTRKTLWSVDYTGIGYNGIARRFFETYAEAKEFAKRDYSDNPVKRTYTAANAAKVMDEQAAEDACNAYLTK